eukprot:192128-Lingulodinium_polyedra.AAC.1
MSIWDVIRRSQGRLGVFSAAVFHDGAVAGVIPGSLFFRPFPAQAGLSGGAEPGANPARHGFARCSPLPRFGAVSLPARFARSDPASGLPRVFRCGGGQ